MMLQSFQKCRGKNCVNDCCHLPSSHTRARARKHTHTHTHTHARTHARAATHNNIENDAPLEVRYWPHPVEIPLMRKPTEIPHNVINIFTDGSKIGGKVGAAAVIIKDDKFIHQSKFRLHKRCSNNQAEQVAVLKALEQIQNLQLKEDEEKIAVVNRQQSDTGHIEK